MKLSKIYKKIIKESNIRIGLYDFDDDRWITDQSESDKYYGKARVDGSIISNVVYHGTNNANQILKKGLWHGSFVATDWKKASMYGNTILKITLPIGYKISWGEDENELRVVNDVDPKYIQIFKEI